MIRIGHRKVGGATLCREPWSATWRLTICFGPIDVPDAFIPWRYWRNWSFTLPQAIYRQHYDISVKWTGREVTLVGLQWFGHVWMWG